MAKKFESEKADAEYRKEQWQTTAADRPLVAHFAANDPEQLLAACRLVEGECDAVDINLGCPQVETAPILLTTPLLVRHY